MWRKVRCLHSSTGQALIEFALVSPLLFLLLVGLFDLGRAVVSYNTLADAAQRGARQAIYLESTDQQIRTAARSDGFVVSSLADSDIVIQPSTRTMYGQVTVTVNYQFNAVTPMLSNVWGGGPINMSASATEMVQ